MKILKQQLLKSIQNDLEEIEKYLEANLNPNLEFCREISSHILFAGGKRLRPLLFVLAARICGKESTSIKNFSTLFEFLHSATLLHDDVVDEGELRRKKKTAHLVYGTAPAVLTGDFLLARSVSLACESGKMEIVKIVSSITEKMSQGEINQLLNKKNMGITIEDYLFIISHKTAYLIEGACKAGAVIADASQKEKEALACYGLNIGIAFQIADDILDYNVDATQTGKKAGADLKEGKITLPLIYTLSKSDKDEKQIIQSLIEKDTITTADLTKLKQLIEKYQGFHLTKQKANLHIEKAKQALEIFENSETKNTLLQIADYVLLRNN